MQPVASDGAPAPYWSMAGILAGARVMIPALPGAVVFAAAFGALAAQKGLTPLEGVLMSAFVFAGVSQFVAMEIWSPQMTASVIFAIAVSTLVVNLRMVLMSASLQPWFAPLPAWQVYPLLYYLTDPGWLIAMRYRGEGGRDLGVHGATTVLFLLVWLVAVTGGYFLGSLIANPQRYGLDLAMPVFFAVMLVPLWRGPRRGIAWAIAGVVALAVQYLVPGWWFIVAGSIAGAVAGGFLEPDGAPAPKAA